MSTEIKLTLQSFEHSVQSSVLNFCLGSNYISTRFQAPLFISLPFMHQGLSKLVQALLHSVSMNLLFPIMYTQPKPLQQPSSICVYLEVAQHC